jgi:hypothetical protein
VLGQHIYGGTGGKIHGSSKGAASCLIVILIAVSMVDLPQYMQRKQEKRGQTGFIFPVKSSVGNFAVGKFSYRLILCSKQLKGKVPYENSFL